MENKVLSARLGARAGAGPQGGSPSEPPAASALDRAVDRSLEPRREAARGEVRRLVDAALRLIEREGRLEPAVSAIVREAGLSNQAFYRHFRSKHELLVAVLDEGLRQLASYLERRMARTTTATEAVREWVRGVLAQALHPKGATATRPFALGRGRLAERYPQEVRQSERQLSALLRDAIARGVASGELASRDPDADAECIYHLATGWMQARLVEGEPPAAGRAEALEAFALAGLQPRATSGKA